MLHVLAALRPDGRAPTVGEAQLAAAAFAVTDGRIGAVPLPLSELLAAHQLAAVTALLPGTSVWGAARTAGLVLGALTAVLLWGVLRRLGCGGGSTALGVGIVGVLPAAVGLHAAVTPAAVAVPWLLGAVLLSWRGRVAGVAAVVAAAVAVLTAPLLGAVLLALAAHAVADRPRDARRPSRYALAGGLAVAAVAVAVAAADSGPLAGRAAPPIPTGAALAAVLCGLVVVAAAWWVRWAHPLLGPALLVLAALLVPGPGRAAAALTALPLLAVVAAAVADDVVARAAARVPVPERFRPAAALAVSAAVLAALAAVPAPRAPVAGAAVPAGAPADPAAVALRAWADQAAAPGAAVHADALDRAELVAAGFPPARLRDLGGPVPDGDLVLHTDRSTGSPAACAPGTLLAAVPRPVGTAEICGARPAVGDPEPQARPGRVRVGTALAGNPGLRLPPDAAELLRQGAVDPRLMIVLATLASRHTLDVADFPSSALEPYTAVRRRVLLTAVDGAPVAASSPLRDWLHGQHPPYAPTVLRDDPAGLLVGYVTPAPPGLLAN